MAKLGFHDSLRISAASAALMIAAALASSITASQAASTRQPTNEYAVKFVCGRMEASEKPNGPVVPGVYATAVNVHNPGGRIRIDRKVALAPPLIPGEISDYRSATLDYDQAVEFGCGEILAQLKEPPKEFVTGFLVIHSPTQLDVVSVYTAGSLSGTEVATLHTERVSPRSVRVPRGTGSPK